MSERPSVVAIVQARTGSSRLPGKVLSEICGDSILLFGLRRVSRAKNVDRIIVATTNNPSDAVIQGLAESNGYDCYRGDEDDVLSRFYGALRECTCDIVVRLNADNPLVDPHIVDRVISTLRDSGADYCSTILDESWPLGMHIEAFKYECLEQAYRSAASRSDREHVTPYIYNNPDLFKLVAFPSYRELSHFRLTVDYEADIEFLSALEGHFGQELLFSTCDDLIEFLENESHINEINRHLVRQQKIRR